LGTYQYFWCVDGSQVGCPERANIVLILYQGENIYVVDFTCVTEEFCVPPPPDDNPPNDPPCVPIYDPNLGITLECEADEGEGFEWGYAINVWTKVPPHGAKVQPFPRWLVSKAGTLTLNRDPLYSVEGAVRGSGGEGGFWSQQINFPPTLDPNDPAPGDIQNYSIGLRWRMAFPGDNLFGGPPVPPSCWNFDERSWNIAGGYAAPAACGDIVQHAYETSSWEKPHNGARFDYEASGCAKVPDDWTLPAYQVTVPTYWIGEWATEWWRWEKTGTEWGDCLCLDFTPDPPTQGCTAPAGICNQPGEWYGKLGEDTYEWIHYFVGWNSLDLRLYGSPDWYYESFRVRTEGIAGNWCPNHIYVGGPGHAVPIPVIEVQSIIVDPCRLDGTCGDLNP